MNEQQKKLKHDYDMVWHNELENINYSSNILQRRIDRKAYYDIIKRYISRWKNPKVLELGCGTGIDINLIKEKYKFAKAFASDISEKSIKVALEVSKNFPMQIYFFAANTWDLPLKQGKIDLIFSQGLIEHFEDPAAVIKEQMRVLKKGGILIVNVPQKYTGYTLMKKKLIRSGKWQLGWETEFSYKDLRKIGRSLGLAEKGVVGYQYWKSWKEPVFVLRDLYDKFHRRNFWQLLRPFRTIKHIYDRLWEQLEAKWGHYFLQNIVIVFQKKTL